MCWVLGAAQAREERLAKARREMEYNEMKGCTFAPEIKRDPMKQPEGPVIVRGLGRFIETKELARRLEEEQRWVACSPALVLMQGDVSCLPAFSFGGGGGGS